MQNMQRCGECRYRFKGKWRCWVLRDVETPAPLKAHEEYLAQVYPRSPPLEHPDVVLIPTATTDLFRRSKTPTLLQQLVAKGHHPQTIRTLRPACKHQNVSIPAQASYASFFGDFLSIRQVLVSILNRLAVGDHSDLKVNDRLAMVDPHDAALKRGCDGAERARLPIQNPLA
jgi:hypothetical protein